MQGSPLVIGRQKAVWFGYISSEAEYHTSTTKLPWLLQKIVRNIEKESQFIMCDFRVNTWLSLVLYALFLIYQRVIESVFWRLALFPPPIRHYRNRYLPERFRGSNRYARRRPLQYAPMPAGRRCIFFVVYIKRKNMTRLKRLFPIKCRNNRIICIADMRNPGSRWKRAIFM